MVRKTANWLSTCVSPGNGRASNDRHVAEKARAQSVGRSEMFRVLRRNNTITTIMVSVSKTMKSEITMDCPNRRAVPMETTNA